MATNREHPLNAPLESMVRAMEMADLRMADMAEGIGDFDSVELTPEEDELVFNSPSLRYLGQVEPQTGLPYTNAQAAQLLLQEIGPEEYFNYVTDYVRRYDRRQKDRMNG